jgi:hypothetical protein
MDPMFENIPSKSFAIMLTCAVLLQPAIAAAAPVPVRHAEGLIHGFLLLSTMEGNPLAHGDQTQVSRGDRVTNHLVFRFKDGSIRDETAVFSQRGTFRLLSYHLLQKGPTFQSPMEVSIVSSSGQVTVRYTDDGKEKVETDRLQLPSDLANGMIFTLLKNVSPDGPPTTVSMVATTPKPRVVKLAISPKGDEPFSVGGSQRTAMHFVLKVEIGGVAGAMAQLLGKQPADIHVWVLGGDAPAFVKSEGPLYFGGPDWRIELTSPVWPRPASEDSDKSKKPGAEK